MWLVSGSGGVRSRSPIASARRTGSYTWVAASSEARRSSGGQRSGPVDVAAPVGEQLGQMGGGVAVAAVLEHSRQQLVGRLLRAQLRHVVLGRRQEQPRLQLQERGDQDQELGRRVEIELAGALQVLEVGDDDLAERDLGEAHLLAQDDRHQQVERPGEDVEVEIELCSPHRG